MCEGLRDKHRCAMATVVNGVDVEGTYACERYGGACA